MKKIRILIADDHPIVREGYKKILMSQPDMDVTGEAGNGQEVLDLTQKKDFDLILLDISMPGRSGLEILKELKGQKPHLPVMILSIYPEEQYAVRAFRDGASGYLTKASTPKELISAIHKVSQGGRYVTEALAEKLTYFLHGDAEKTPHEKLSDRKYPGHASHRLGQDGDPDRRRAVPERKDHQHLPAAHPGKDAVHHECRDHHVRHPEQAAGLAEPPSFQAPSPLRGEGRGEGEIC